jgi:hypothetical protein
LPIGIFDSYRLWRRRRSVEIQISQASPTRWKLQLHTNDCRCTCSHYFCFRLSAVLFQCHEEHQCPTSCRPCPLSCARSFPYSSLHFVTDLSFPTPSPSCQCAFSTFYFYAF